MRIRGKNLTRRQKIFLTKKGKDASEWLVRESSSTREIYVHRENKKELIYCKITGEQINIDKEIESKSSDKD